MNSPMLTIGAVLFGIPFVLMFVIALTGNDIPRILLIYGGWSMAFGVITMGLGAFFTIRGG